jgi:hypothetical protein
VSLQNWFYRSHALRPLRRWWLSSIARRTRQAVAREAAFAGTPLHTHDSFGAVWIHPRHLAFWYFFATETDLQRAQQSGLTARMIESTRTGLLLRGYPREVISGVGISFASDEDVQRTTNGDYYRYLK